MVKYYQINRFPNGSIPVYIENLLADDNVPFLHYPEEYCGQEVVKLCCTQHYNAFYRPNITPYRQKKITQAWVDFLSCQQLSLRKVQLCTRTPQRILDALSHQKSVEWLRIKWCAAPDISSIRHLSNLTKLYLGIGTAVRDISPLKCLKKLEALCLDSTTKVTDYSPLGELCRLKALDIGGNFQNKAVIHMDSDEFLFQLEKLEFLHLPDVCVKERRFLWGHNVQSLKYACFRKE